MEYKIEYEETVKRVKEITIEVDNEEEGKEIADALWDESDMYEKPKDIKTALEMMDIKILREDTKQETYKCDVS